MKRQLIYHYYAFVQLNPGAITNFDGIATYNSPILTAADYAHLKKLICEEHHANVIVSSLTLLSDHHVPEQ